MTHLRSLLIVAFALLLAACAGAPVERRSDQDMVILISIDGFRADYLDRGATPTLAKLAQGGARAEMRPSFPSVTFPNHYTLVTGKRPDHHGIVNNRFEDARFPMPFSMDAKVAFEPAWWEEATPLWESAERQGIPSATMFWPGSDYVIHGVRPGRWRLFDEDLPGFARVDALLAWLDEPASRPRFLTLYFDQVDTAGHGYGPDSPEVLSATAEVDAAIARLLDGLKRRGLADKTDLVIVADHGMASVSPDRVMTFDAALTPEVARIIWDGPFAGIAPMAGHEAEAERILLGRKDHGECWRKGELPARFAYGANPRVPAIVCLADIGWAYRNPASKPYDRPSRGAHGFDPASKEMAALFIANGPAIRRGVTLPAFDNVSVYPLLARLAGIKPEPNDGHIEDVAAALN